MLDLPPAASPEARAPGDAPVPPLPAHASRGSRRGAQPEIRQAWAERLSRRRAPLSQLQPELTPEALAAMSPGARQRFWVQEYAYVRLLPARATVAAPWRKHWKRPTRLWVERMVHDGVYASTIARIVGASDSAVQGWVASDAIDLPRGVEALSEIAASLGVDNDVVRSAARAFYLPIWTVLSHHVVHRADAELLRREFADLISPEQAALLMTYPQVLRELELSRRRFHVLQAKLGVTLPSWRSYGADLRANARYFSPQDVLAFKARLGPRTKVLPARPRETFDSFEFAKLLGHDVRVVRSWVKRGAPHVLFRGERAGPPRIGFHHRRMVEWLRGRAEAVMQGSVRQPHHAKASLGYARLIEAEALRRGWLRQEEMMPAPERLDRARLQPQPRGDCVTQRDPVTGLFVAGPGKTKRRSAQAKAEAQAQQAQREARREARRRKAAQQAAQQADQATPLGLEEAQHPAPAPQAAAPAPSRPGRAA